MKKALKIGKESFYFTSLMESSWREKLFSIVLQENYLFDLAQ